MDNKIYNQIIKEHFDLKDRETLKILSSINEQDKGVVLQDLTSKLYDIIIDKVDDVDYGTIPNSKGDILKVEGIEKVIECLTIMIDLITACHQDPAIVTQVVDCINNIKDRKDLFEKAYVLDLELPCMIYNTMVLSIFSATTFLITTCIDFIKDTTGEAYNMIVDKTGLVKSRDYVVLKSIIKFNNTCRDGSLNKSLEYLTQIKAKNLMGTIGAMTASGAVAATVLVLTIIPLMRELIYFFYYTRVRLADYADTQSQLIQMNAFALENNPRLPKEKKDTIFKKQMKISDALKKFANFITISNKKAENQSFSLINSENRRYKFSEISDDVPASAIDSLF